jgi:Tn3 transposase DDE domain
MAQSAEGITLEGLQEVSRWYLREATLKASNTALINYHHQSTLSGVWFLSYCLHVTLRRRLRDLAPGLTPRAALEKFSAMQMIDVYLPTSDGRTIILSRYTQPENDLQLLLNQLKLQLPDQPAPKITAAGYLVP